MGDNVSSFGIGFGGNRFHQSAAFAETVTGVDIKMYRIKTEGTVVPGTVSKRENLFSAVPTNKPGVVFSENSCSGCFPFKKPPEKQLQNYYNAN